MSCEKVSYVVVSYNSEKYLEKCLDSILSQSHKFHEIIIVDNNSIDNTLSIAGRFCNIDEKIELISNNTNEGFATAIIQGVSKSSGEYVAILNADVYLDPQWCSFLLESFSKDDKIVSASGNVLLPDGSLQSAGGMMDKYGAVIQRGSSLYESLNLEKNFPIFYNDGSSFILRKKLFESIGLDTKLFLYYEDVDLSWKINMFGYKISHVSKAISYHDVGHSFYDINPRKFYFIIKNRLYLCQKNYSLSTQMRRLPVIFFLILIDAIIYDIFKPQKGFIIQFLRAIKWNISNLKYIVKEQKKLNAKRILTDDQIDANLIPKSIELSIITKKLG
ncbi:putative Glycosyl transferase family 2 [Nitrosotalea sinensis]|uniref:Putative Glycosyl transferase family 2 n=1 Tax=Nitrosotalea sinensis TaxID=1499975 RepID=A0A2H1EEC9_9ARCH|nr:glycosyltransferase family 2 protein [Candidatus Nitrosotalea sinensis]SHO42844.1 putative Glycosyl transferase family 2 [Candidatus Nitrosotalea sinensis]